MTIANELSSDIAAALVAAKDKHPDQLNELKQILLEVHRTLQQLKQKTRGERLFAKFGSENSKHC
jgi:hypothetical protein